MTLRGAIIFSVFVVNPEKSKKGINTIGEISTATYKLGIKVPKKIPIVIPSKHSNIATKKKPKNWAVLNPTIKYTTTTNTEGKRAVKGISMHNLDV